MTSEQIDDYCKRLAEAWKRAPEWELGELAIRATDRYVGKSELEFCTSEQVITAIERMVEK